MRALHRRTSILIAGILGGFNLLPFDCNHNHISNAVGSLKISNKLSQDGMKTDAEKLAGDWKAVRHDLMSSFNSLTNEHS